MGRDFSGSSKLIIGVPATGETIADPVSGPYAVTPPTNRSQHGHSRGPFDVLHRVVNSHIHLIQTLVHATNPIRLLPRQDCFLPNDRAQLTDLLARTIRPTKQSM